MGERVGDIGVAVWIALEKAHQGEVSHLASQWLDSANPAPGYLADALTRLTRGSPAVDNWLSPPRTRDAQKVLLTDTGRARYTALCQVYTFSTQTGHRHRRPQAASSPALAIVKQLHDHAKPQGSAFHQTASVRTRH